MYYRAMSKEELALTIGPDAEARQFLNQKIDEHNIAATGRGDDAEIELWLRDGAGRLVGGLTAWTWAGWMQINLLWVDPAWRGRGYGEELLGRAEAEALARGCRRVVLDTFSFQAPQLYRKRGYEVFGSLAGFPDQHTRYYLTKTLA
jgi:GNAT superfamily N-acetyltransferase